MKTAVEAATMLLRIDDIVSGISKKQSAPKPSAKVGVSSLRPIYSSLVVCYSAWWCRWRGRGEGWRD